jgi:hypothetical protein
LLQQLQDISILLKKEKFNYILHTSKIGYFEIAVNILAYICEIWRKCHCFEYPSKDELQKHIKHLIVILTRKLYTLNDQQILDFTLEIKRLQLIAKCLSIKNGIRENPQLVHALDCVNRIAFDVTRRFPSDNATEEWEKFITTLNSSQFFSKLVADKLLEFNEVNIQQTWEWEHHV